MKKILSRLIAFCLTLLLCLPALAESALDYDVSEKMYKQLQAGSGFQGTLTVVSEAVAGKESDAYTTIKPFTFDVKYLFTRENTATKTAAESRALLTLMNGEASVTSAQASYTGNALYLKADLLGDGWYALGSLVDTADQGLIAETAISLVSQSAMPGLLSFALGMAGRAQGFSADLDDVLNEFSTKVDLWIEGYRQEAVLGKLNDGTTTMQVRYAIPASAVKAQLKQLVMDLLSREDVLSKLKPLFSDAEFAQFFDPAQQSYYFFAIDELPLTDALEISRTVSLKGDTLALSLALPMVDSRSGALTLRYDRKAGEGDIPGDNVIELENASTLWRVSYQEYSTMTDTKVYQGTLLRQAIGAESAKKLSAAFTLTHQRATSTNSDGKDQLTQSVKLSLAPDYTPDVSDDETPEATTAQAEEFVTFRPVDMELKAAFTSGQAKNASTALAASLVISGETLPQIITATLEGKTTGRWEAETYDPQKAEALGALDADALSALLSQAGVKAGLLLLPYVGLPTTTVAGVSDAPTADAATTAASATETSTADDATATLIPTVSPTPSDTPSEAPDASVEPTLTETPTAADAPSEAPVQSGNTNG